MFRLEGFCDDKNLAKVHHALNGLVMNFKTVPVGNGKVVNGEAKATNSGELHELFLAWAKANRKTSVIPEDIRSFCSSIGRSPNGYSNTLIKLIDAGVLKRPRKNGKAAGYPVVA